MKTAGNAQRTENSTKTKIAAVEGMETAYDSNMPYIKVPKFLIEDERFAGLTDSERLAYSLMLDRVSLSVKNNLVDAFGRPFIYFTYDSLMNALHIRSQKVRTIFQHLTAIGLIRTEQEPGRGVARALRIYVNRPKQVATYETKKQESTRPVSVKAMAPELITETETVSTEAEQVKSSLESGFENHSGDFDNHQETLRNSKTIHTNSNNTKSTNHSDPSLSPLPEETRTQTKRDQNERNLAEVYESVREQVRFDDLMQVFQNPTDQELVTSIINTMVVTMMSKSEYIWCRKQKTSMELVRSQLSKITYAHIKNLVERLCNVREFHSKVGSADKYLLTCLFNAPMNTALANKSFVNNLMYQEFYGQEEAAY